MADVLGLSDISSKDTGKGKQLKTGNLKRSYNMPKACVQQKMKPKSKGGQGMTRAAAMKACYPLVKKVSKEKASKSGKITKILKKAGLVKQKGKAPKGY
jgi:hypothetical protein